MVATLFLVFSPRSRMRLRDRYSTGRIKWLACVAMHQDSFVTDLAIVLGVAALTGLVFRLLRQPSILGYLFAGLLVGPYLPVPLLADPHRVHALSEFGVVLVMFAVGLEFRLEKFFRVLPVSGLTGLIEISALIVGGYFLGLALGWTEIGSLFLGACLCISSTMAVSKIFEQRPVADDVRTSVFGVLVLQDVAAIALIAVMTALSKGANAEFGDVMVLLGKLIAVLVCIIALGMFVIPRWIRLIERTKSKETLVVGAIGFVLRACSLGRKIGLLDCPWGVPGRDFGGRVGTRKKSRALDGCCTGRLRLRLFCFDRNVRQSRACGQASTDLAARSVRGDWPAVRVSPAWRPAFGYRAAPLGCCWSCPRANWRIRVHPRADRA